MRVSVQDIKFLPRLYGTESLRETGGFSVALLGKSVDNGLNDEDCNQDEATQPNHDGLAYRNQFKPFHLYSPFLNIATKKPTVQPPSQTPAPPIKFPNQGEHEANMIFYFVMARRHLPSPQLTEAELAELRAKLDGMPQHALEIYYKATHNACRFEVRLPSARLMQELVTVWKALRRRK